MDDDGRSAVGQTPSRESDLEQLAAIASWYTPDSLMRASRMVHSMRRVSGIAEGVGSIASGRYKATRGMLAAPEQIEQAVYELRTLFSSDDYQDDDGKRQSLLEIWMAVESCLSQAEHDELRSAVLGRIFPRSKAPDRLSRAGFSQVGGE